MGKAERGLHNTRNWKQQEQSFSTEENNSKNTPGGKKQMVHENVLFKFFRVIHSYLV